MENGQWTLTVTFSAGAPTGCYAAAGIDAANTPELQVSVTTPNKSPSANAAKLLHEVAGAARACKTHVATSDTVKIVTQPVGRDFASTRAGSCAEHITLAPAGESVALAIAGITAPQC